MSGTEGISGSRLDHLSLESLQATSGEPARPGADAPEPAYDGPARDGRRMLASGMAHQLATMARIMEAEDLAKADGAGTTSASPISSFVPKAEAKGAKSTLDVSKPATVTAPDLKTGVALAGKLAKMSPADAAKQLADTGSLVSVEMAIQAGKVKDPKVLTAYLNATTIPANQQTSLQKLDDKTLQAVTKALREGGITSKTAAVSVGIEMAARSKWGKENPEVVKSLRDTQDKDGAIKFDLQDGLGMTDDKKIHLSPKLLKSPEALAAILAHEGTHVHQGDSADSLPAETAGNLAQGQVWQQLGDKADKAVPDDLAQLNQYGKDSEGGTPAVMAHVAASYLDAARIKISERVTGAVKPEGKFDKAENWVGHVDMLTLQLTSIDGIAAQKLMTADQAMSVVKAAITAGAGETQMQHAGAALRNLPDAVKKDVLAKAAKADRMTPEALAQFTASINAKG